MPLHHALAISANAGRVSRTSNIPGFGLRRIRATSEDDPRRFFEAGECLHVVVKIVCVYVCVCTCVHL